MDSPPEPERIVQINLGGSKEDQEASLNTLREFMKKEVKEKHWLLTGVGGAVGLVVIGVTLAAGIGAAAAIGVAVYRWLIGLIG